MASRKRLPKPEGESDCSRRTATVPVTSFIDVMRNARPQKRVTRELVAVVSGCGVLMLAPPCKPDGQSRPFRKAKGTRRRGGS